MNLLSSLLNYVAQQIAALRTADSTASGNITALGNRMTTAEGDIDSLESQFTTVVSAVTTDTEVTNIRVGDDGVTYSTAGEAVRTQFSNVKDYTSTALSDTRMLTDLIYEELGHGNKPQLTDSSATNMIYIGSNMVIGHKYRIYLKFNNYSTSTSDTNNIGKMTDFYVATGTSGSDRVTNLRSQIMTALDPSSDYSYPHLGEWIYIDYTATAAINRLRPQYNSSYSSESNSIDWIVLDLSNYEVQTEIKNLTSVVNDALITTVSSGEKAQSGNYGANAIALGATMYEGQTYEISLNFDGAYSSFSSMVRNIYVATSDASGGRVEDIFSLFYAAAGNNYPQADTWYTVEYTPTKNITYIACAYSSSYVASADNILKYKVVEKSDRITQLENSIEALFNFTPVNTWDADAVPTAITNKLRAMSDDILVVCQGDSLTGLIEYCDAQDDASHCPAGMQYKSWTYLLWSNLARIKPMCDRLDSQRSGSDFFTKTGTWTQVDGTKFDAEGYTYDFERERSVACLTYQSASNNAAIAFTFDANTYDKCNIVFSLKPDGAKCEISITEGNGKMLASLDRSTWVEANGFAHDQNSNPNSLTYSQIQNEGLAVQQRHRRIWMKKVDGVTGDVTITYKVSSTQTLDSPYMYCWGTERWSGNTVFVDNAGRGGRYTKTLSYNISDIFDRNPDFAMYEMPIANETDEGLSNIYGFYNQYFFGNNNNSYKVRSENYTKVPLIVFLPSGRGTFFDNNNGAIFDSVHQVSGDPPAYDIYMTIFNWLKGELAEYTNVSANNLYCRLLNEASGINQRINLVFGSNGQNSLTQDTTHLNQRGARMWLKYLLPLFQR